MIGGGNTGGDDVSAGLKKGFLTGAIAVLLGATLVQTVGTSSAGAVNFDRCARWNFRVSEGYYNWNEAIVRARQMGGKLAVITSAAENRCAEIAREAACLGGCAIWIGGSDLASGGTWRWDGGTSRDARMVFYSGGSTPPYAYSNWAGGEPSGGGERCAMIWTYGTWNDGYCENGNRFLYEY